MKKVAIITARGGSKRIPRKNIRPFLGKPIIAYSIEAAIQSHLFDEVMISTDDMEIAAIGKQYGATVPFFRSHESSSDTATTVDALTDVFQQYSLQGVSFDYACCLYPTAPFVSAEKLQQAFALMEKNNWEVVFPVMPFSYPIWRSLKEENGNIQMNWPEYAASRSQDLPPAYHDAGQFYFLKVEPFLKEKKLFGSNSGGMIIDEMEGQDIDNLVDWELAELKYKIRERR